MGTHATVLVWQDDNKEPLNFYQHYDGYNIAKEVAEGLKAGQGRWDDPTYLARIIFTQMTKSNPYDDTTGFGIGIGKGFEAEYMVVIYTNYEETNIVYQDEAYSPEQFIEKFAPEEKILGHTHNANNSYIVHRDEVDLDDLDKNVIEGSWVKH
jgi:hypothetical protein